MKNPKREKYICQECDTEIEQKPSYLKTLKVCNRCFWREKKRQNTSRGDKWWRK